MRRLVHICNKIKVLGNLSQDSTQFVSILHNANSRTVCRKSCCSSMWLEFVMHVVCLNHYIARYHLTKLYLHQTYHLWNLNFQVGFWFTFRTKVDIFKNKVLVDWFLFFTDFVFAKLAPDRYLQNTEFWSTLPFPNKSTAFPCIADAFEYLNRTYGDEGLTILVTGSLHLVGATLNFIKTQ